MRYISVKRKNPAGAKVPRRKAPVRVTRPDGTVEVIQDTRTYAQRRDASVFSRARVSAKLKKLIRERDKVCQSCGTDRGPFHVDHKRPYSKGGWPDPANLQLLCGPCNMAKGAKWQPKDRGLEGFGGRA